MTFRVFLALGAIALVAVCFPESAHAWTPGTHVYLGESLLANLHLLPAATAELLRAFPFDFLYGNIAADSSIAKKYAPVGRHCHYWHVGQEIHDEARNDSLRAFGLGYLCHLAADTVAHNYFVPRQLVLTASTASVGHAYWESRVETHLGLAYARAAKDLIQMDTSAADGHLARIISPTLFSVGTNRRLFKGLVHLAETRGFQSGLEGGGGSEPVVAHGCGCGAAPGTLLRLHGGLAVERDAGAEAAGSVGRATAARGEDGAASGAAGIGADASGAGCCRRRKSTSGCRGRN